MRVSHPIIKLSFVVAAASLAISVGILVPQGSQKVALASDSGTPKPAITCPPGTVFVPDKDDKGTPPSPSDKGDCKKPTPPPPTPTPSPH